MKRLVRGTILLFAAISASFAAAEKAGEVVFEQLETRHPYAADKSGRLSLVWSDTLSSKDASYIAPHFSRFHLAAGDHVIVRSPDGKQEWRYTGLGRAELGESKDGFWAVHINGDSAVIELWSAGGDPGFGFVLDRYARGFPIAQDESGIDAVKSICGVDNSSPARCYQFTEPTIYNKSRTIARLLVQGTDYCTGFLVGSEGHLITNHHCIANATAAQETDYEFMTEGATCGAACPNAGSCPGTTLIQVGTLVQTDVDLDYSLVLLPGNPSTTHGFLKLRKEDPAIDERIYVPGHPRGLAKRIAVTSTDPNDGSGFCEIASLSAPACVVGSSFPDIGYFCDTEGGSSGSPVLGYEDHKVVALHHCGACVNRALHITDVIEDLGASLPVSATYDPVGAVKLDHDSYGCDGTISITLYDDSLQAVSTQGVTIASTTESSPEIVLLSASPFGSGKFTGSISTAIAESAPDGSLSVANGDTITVTYIDADDEAGGVNVPRTDMALADCAAPVLTSVQATNVLGSDADISFTSSEPCNAAVTYGLAGAPPPTQTLSDPALGTSHTIHLSGLLPCNDYIFRVACTDLSGNPGSNDNQGSYFVFTTGTHITPTYVASGLPATIPDNDDSGVIGSILISDVNTLIDVNVKVSITHSYDTDLVLYLIGPDDTAVLLSNRRPTDGGGINFTDTVWDDQATTPFSSVSWGQSPYTGSYLPEQALSAFSGKVASGTWRLKVVDAASVDIGSLDEFELSFIYQAQACGPNAARYSQGLISDYCSGSGSGSGNLVWDDGEDAQFSVTVRNSGTVPLTQVSVELIPLTPGVVMTLDSANYPNIPFGSTAASHAPHFGARLPVGLACGTAVSFQAIITSNQGTFEDTVVLVSGQIISGSGVALDQRFTSGIPIGWTIVNGGTGPGASATWTTTNPGARTFVSPLIAPVAIVDADFVGSGTTFDEQLLTPVMDLAAATTVTLEFDQFFRHYPFGSDEKGDVDVRSTRTGGLWVNVFRNELVSSGNPDHRVVNISSQAAGAADVQVRFRYHSAGWEFWWELDNVKVTYQAPTACNQTSCGSLALPGEVSTTSVRWLGRTSLIWAPVSTATSYKLYRGVGSDISKLLNVNADSCLRATLTDVSATDLSENPSVATMYWWLVRAVNQVGEGSPGFASAGPRSQDSFGFCP